MPQGLSHSGVYTDDPSRGLHSYMPSDLHKGVNHYITDLPDCQTVGGGGGTQYLPPIPPSPSCSCPPGLYREATAQNHLTHIGALPPNIPYSDMDYPSMPANIPHTDIDYPSIHQLGTKHAPLSPQYPAHLTGSGGPACVNCGSRCSDSGGGSGSSHYNFDPSSAARNSPHLTHLPPNSSVPPPPPHPPYPPPPHPASSPHQMQRIASPHPPPQSPLVPPLQGYQPPPREERSEAPDGRLPVPLREGEGRDMACQSSLPSLSQHDLR